MLLPYRRGAGSDSSSSAYRDAELRTTRRCFAFMRWIANQTPGTRTRPARVGKVADVSAAFTFRSPQGILPSLCKHDLMPDSTGTKGSRQRRHRITYFKLLLEAGGDWSPCLRMPANPAQIVHAEHNPLGRAFYRRARRITAACPAPRAPCESMSITENEGVTVESPLQLFVDAEIREATGSKLYYPGL